MLRSVQSFGFIDLVIGICLEFRVLTYLLVCESQVTKPLAESRFGETRHESRDTGGWQPYPHGRSLPLLTCDFERPFVDLYQAMRMGEAHTAFAARGLV